MNIGGLKLTSFFSATGMSGALSRPFHKVSKGTPSSVLPPVASSQRALAKRLSSFREALRSAVGNEVMKRLTTIAKNNDEPIVLIKGDMLTGKSTQARELAKALGRPDEVGSVGSQVMRPLAEKRGISIEELGAQLKAEPKLEAAIDFEALVLAASGGVAVLESRMAGEYGALLRSLGRKNVVTVELLCGPRERALRMVERLAGPQARRRIEPQLSEVPGASLEAYLKTIASIKDPEPKLAELGQHGAEIAGRDEVDAARLRKLYGFDYRKDGPPSDILVDTSALDSNQVRAELIRRVESRLGSTREVDAHAQFGTKKQAVPALLEDWSNATLKASAVEAARATYAPQIEQSLSEASQELGRELNRKERSAVIRAVDKVYLPSALPKAEQDISRHEAETIKKAQKKYLKFDAPNQRDPFLPIVAEDPAARAKEIMLWESPSLMVLVDRFMPTPQVLVVPKRPMSFPTQASPAELAEMAKVAKAVSDAFSQVSGTPPAETWINPPQHLSVTRLHVHVAPELDKTSASPKLWSDVTQILQTVLSRRARGALVE